MAWHYLLTFDPHNLIAQLLKNPSAMQETWVQSLGWEDPLEKRKATHSSILAWRIPWTVQSTESQRVGHNRAAFTFDLQGAFLCTCNLSLVPREGGVEIPLILCSNKVFPLFVLATTITLKCLQETSTGCLPCFCCYFHFRGQIGS